jgi:predicted alpha/beta superfamily hydrolase
MTRTGRARLYFLFSALGLITAWYFNAVAVMEQQDYLAAWFGTSVDWVLSADLLVVAMAVVSFMIFEARRLGMRRVWIYFVVSAFTAMAFTFPLFMAMRERRLQQLELAGGRLTDFEVDGHRVQVWTPGNLTPETPVLVMHDGKNVFDRDSSTFGVTWGVLEALQPNRAGWARFDRAPVIVAVWGLGDETRINQLGPEKVLTKHPALVDELAGKIGVADTGLMGDAYQDLLALRVLPEVEKRFGLKLDRRRTAIAGSSMGGLASLYALHRHPDRWGAALALSTHWPIGNETMVRELTALVPKAGRHLIYTDAGTTGLDADYPPLHEIAIRELEKLGYKQGRDFYPAIFPGTGHDERWWAGRIEIPVNWWLERCA